MYFQLLTHILACWNLRWYYAQQPKKNGNKACEIKVTNESDRSKYMYTTQSILYKVLNNLDECVVTVV